MRTLLVPFAWFALAVVLLMAGIGWLFLQVAGWLYAFFDDLFSR